MMKKSDLLIRAWNFVSKGSLSTRLRQSLVRTIGILTVAERWSRLQQILVRTIGILTVAERWSLPASLDVPLWDLDNCNCIKLNLCTYPRMPTFVSPK
jgi:hypothetical protein